VRPEETPGGQGGIDNRRRLTDSGKEEAIQVEGDRAERKRIAVRLSRQAQTRHKDTVTS
jgi:hypothetical protein